MTPTKFIMNGHENRAWMDVLCQVREVMDNNLKKHGEPTLLADKTINNLKEEFEEVVEEMSNDDDFVNVGMEREIRDLVAYGLTILHRTEMKRRGRPCTNNNQSIRMSSR